MTLRLNGDNSGFTEIKAADTAGDNSIKLPANNGSANQLLQNGGTAGELQYTSAGGGLHYDSSGRLLIGTSTSLDTGGLFQVNSNANGIINYYEGDNATPVRLRLTKSRGETTAASDDDGLGEITFRGRSTGNSIRTAASISGEVDDAPGATSVPGRLVFSTTGVGGSSATPRMEIGSNGALKLLSGCPGIDFSGTQAAAVNGTMTSETLGTYEQGTWTPSFQGETTAGTYTYGSRAGIYTKVGNIVIVSFSLVNINTSIAGVGTATITGLPFTSTSSFSYNSSPPRFDNFDIGTNTAYVTMLVDNNSTRIKFFTVRNNDSDGVLNVTSKNSDTSDVFGTLMYLT